MNWEKRDCPIKMKLVPYGAGWEDVIIDIQGDHHYYAVSGCLGNGFGGLVESLYVLYPHQNHHQLEERYLSKTADFIGDFKDGKFVNLRPKPPDYRGAYYSVPVQAEFLWDEEGHGVSWTLTRPENEDRDFPLSVRLDEWKSCGSNKITKSYNYTVAYSDLCYAVGKALTEAMKSHGFTGFYESVWGNDINVRHLCFLKACGMGNPDFFKPKRGKEKGEGDISSFKDEIELLLFDM